MRLNNFWRIEIAEKNKLQSSMIVPTGQITDKGIERLKQILFSKYMLNDEEVISELCIKNTIRHSNLIHYNKSEMFDEDNLIRIIYFANSGGMQITISLVYENELTKEEKEKVLSTSSLRIK